MAAQSDLDVGNLEARKKSNLYLITFRHIHIIHCDTVTLHFTHSEGDGDLCQGLGQGH